MRISPVVLEFWIFISRLYCLLQPWDGLLCDGKQPTLPLSHFLQLHGLTHEQITSALINFATDNCLLITQDLFLLEDIKMPRKINHSMLYKYMRQGVTLTNRDGTKICLTHCIEYALSRASEVQVVFVDSKYYVDFMQSMLSHLLVECATRNLPCTGRYVFNVIFFLLVHFVLFVLCPKSLLLFHKVLYFTKCCFVSIGVLFCGRKRQCSNENDLYLEGRGCVPKLQTYTVLVPIYKEDLIIPQLIRSLSDIQYPECLLDVKLLVEEDDQLTKDVLARLNLPDHFSIVQIPYCEPRTKSKAITYGAYLSLGEYTVVYDAEDVPHHCQLLSALVQFERKKGQERCFAVQCPLGWYNTHTGFLPQMMAIEYGMLFDVAMPVLNRLGSFIPLGGSSNHFNSRLLATLKFWDAWNVTEDFELSLRGMLNDYSISYVDSKTEEESVNTLEHWVNQRTRWLKGFLVSVSTCFFDIHRRLYKKPLALLGFYIFGWNNILFPILWPWIFVEVISLHLALQVPMIAVFWLIQFVYVNAYNQYSDTLGRQIYNAIAFSLYNLLLPLPFCKAVWQVLVNRSYWGKTPHFNGKVIR